MNIFKCYLVNMVWIWLLENKQTNKLKQKITLYYQQYLCSSCISALNSETFSSPAIPSCWLIFFRVANVKFLLNSTLKRTLLKRLARNQAMRSRKLHSCHATRVRTSDRLTSCSVRAVRNDHFVQQMHPQPDIAPPLVKIKDAAPRFGDWLSPSLNSLWSVLHTV